MSNARIGLRCHRDYAKDSFVRLQFLLVLSLFCALSAALLAAPVPPGKPASFPSWWFSQGVIVPLNSTNAAPVWPNSYPTSDDFAIVNQGQLKNFATQGYGELEAVAPSYVWSTTQGANLTSLITGWTQTGGDNYAVINLGQLKTVAKPFYDVLSEIGYNTTYPWSGTPDDFAAANIGQVKNVFSFDVGLDSDGNGLPDWWELKYFNQLGNIASSSYDENGFSLLELKRSCPDQPGGDT
jgi:hypothetical protein